MSIAIFEAYHESLIDLEQALVAIGQDPLNPLLVRTVFNCEEEVAEAEQRMMDWFTILYDDANLAGFFPRQTEDCNSKLFIEIVKENQLAIGHADAIAFGTELMAYKASMENAELIKLRQEKAELLALLRRLPARNPNDRTT